MALAYVTNFVQSVGISFGKSSLEQAFSVQEISELKLFNQRRDAQEKRRAQYHWSLLRDSIKNVRKALEQADARDVALVHGIHHDRKLNHACPIQLAIFIPQKKVYLTKEEDSIWQFCENGCKAKMFTVSEQMDHIIFACNTNQFVGWQHKEDTLFLMNEQFEMKSQSQTMGKIYLGTYNSRTGEMLTVGPGFITCWVFRYGARHLIPRKTILTEFDEGNLLKMIVLEDTASRNQRAFFACAKGVVVYNIHEGTLLVHHKELHTRPVTAITFFNPLKYVITGALDGCIKVWDNEWSVKMVFVGHSSAVSALAIYPHGPLFISTAEDCTIRVWSMETCDEVDKTSVAEPVQGLCTTPLYDVFFTYAGRKVDLWRLNHLYHIHTSIGYRVNRIKLTTHPLHPVRAVLMCRDSSVRIISPSNGDVLTTLIMPLHTGLIDAAYAIAENTMFTVSGNGDIVKSKTDVNPCQIVARWRCSSMKEICSYLLVYEYVVDMTLDTHIEPGTNPATPTKTLGKMLHSRNRTLLIGGRKDGCICLFNWDTGNVDFKIEAHGSRGVLNMLANSRLDQLISAGMDNVVKIWRLYPFAEEALVPLMSFYCAHSPAYMSIIKTSFCVAFQDPATATFNVVLYNLPEKTYIPDGSMGEPDNRHDHRPDDDHVDSITGLTSCSKLKLFASSSMDGTIRIWNDENRLIRVLRLNAVPNCIGFFSSHGDLLVGIGLHLYHIPWKQYLPRPYLRRMVSMRFLEPEVEEAIPFDEKRLLLMDKNDVKRLKGAHASFKVTHFEDVLSEEETDIVMREKRIREKAFSELEIRENELGLIRDGGKTSAKKSKSTKSTEREAMQNYMKLFYDRERIVLPAEDPFPEDTLKEKLERKIEHEEGHYRSEAAPATFFQEKLRNRAPGSAAHGFATQGFIPNSVLVKILYPPPAPLQDPSTLRPYRPPVLTAKQLSEIRAFGKTRDLSFPSRSVTFADREESFDLSKRTMEFDLDEEEEQISEEEKLSQEATQLSEKEELAEITDELDQKPTVTPPILPPVSVQPGRRKETLVQEVDEEDEDAFWGRPKSRKEPSFMSRFKDIIERPLSPDTITEPEPEAAAASEEEPLAEYKPKPMAPETQKPLKAIRKLVSRPRQKITIPSPLPEPLPDFMNQFVGAEWFEKYFHNYNEMAASKPWSSDNFINMILKLLSTASFPHKTSMTEALVLVHAQEALSESTCRSAQRKLLEALNQPGQIPSCVKPDEKAFILTAIKGLQWMGICNKEFMVEILTQFLDGDKDVRTCVLDVLNSIGLQDPRNQLQRELDSWDVWNNEDAGYKKNLKNMCSQWLDRWMTSYQCHIKDAVERLQKGQNLQGHIHLGSTPAPRHKSVLPDIPSSLGGGDTRQSRAGGSVTLTINQPDLALAENATYLEAANYFCEMMTEKELESMRKGEKWRAQDETTVLAKNTVLVLPKIAQKPSLVRLGEMHISKCRQSRETTLSNVQQVSMWGGAKKPVPGQLTGFVHCINLPLKPIYIRPFYNPMESGDPLYSEPILITLKSSQKYFIQSNSIVPKDVQLTQSN